MGLASRNDRVVGYAMVVAKSGSKLRESAGPLDESEQRKAAPGPTDLQTEKDGFPQLYLVAQHGWYVQGRKLSGMRFRDYRLSDLVQQFSFALASHIVDRTGSAEEYDFTLWSSPPPENGRPGGAPLRRCCLARGGWLRRNGNGRDRGQLDSFPHSLRRWRSNPGLKWKGRRSRSTAW